ncbi:GNAT family N-acetyltransferase [Rubellicoccus peritrichatus]|uniref:N-acetyltransferase family protein n=1 Tax=Rubellicoccus peritrichatus TaxID=3080537 RepID=A0AAQ3LER9_9BACT|nr:GNAT family N-acetyltransferase [Puniceicoccus sp. CR14]WOO43239.1 N-acetyltransferase family protein [Puniceicoccus sp. CR14]
MIRKATFDDATSIAQIYNYYIENTVITFEEDPIDAEDIIQRIEKSNSAGFSWYVALESESVVGYAYSSKWNERSAYKHTAEVSVYLSHQHRSKGLGTKLYEALFDELKAMRMHVVIGGVTLPNAASVALHEKFGMKKVAHYEQVGFKFEEWLDVGYWQIQLDT